VVVCLGVSGEDGDAAHSARQEDLVDVADEAVEVGVAHRGAVPEVGVLVRGPDGDPPAIAPHEVRAEDHAGVVVLEALGRVHTADLAEASGVGGPQRCRRRTPDGAVSLEVPRLGPLADADIRDQ